MGKEIQPKEMYLDFMKKSVEEHICEGITFEEGFSIACNNFHKIAYMFLKMEKPDFEHFLDHCIRVEIKQSIRRLPMKGV